MSQEVAEIYFTQNTPPLEKAFVNAVASKDVPLAEMYIEQKGIDPDTGTSQFRWLPALVYAEGNRKMLKMLVDHGATATGPALFHRAAEGDKSTVAYLLGLKANPDYTYCGFSCERVSVLFAAVKNGHTEIAELLLQAGSNPDTVSSGGEKGRSSPCAGSAASPLHAAILEKNLDAINLLLKHGANPNLEGTFLWNECLEPPIVWAVKENYLEGVQALLRGGADVNGTTVSGETVLTIARFPEGTGQSNSKIVRVLEEAGGIGKKK